MTRTQTTNTQRTRAIARMLHRLALSGALLVLAGGPAAAHTSPGLNSARPSARVTSAQAQTTLIRETVIKQTHSNPALPIALSAAALAVALAVGAYTLARRRRDRAARGV
ncbi:MAG: hypothetical protein ACYDHH_05670 [Solirubrobacteraceae bacterium]